MSDLDFVRFYREIYGEERSPFPWQVRLAEAVVREGCWPRLLDLPTGVGKTTALDIALFALAARRGDAPRRIFLVVDRRIIVDQAADHARKILARMREGAAGDVAEALRALWGGEAGEDPFEVAVLRGGVPRDGDWAKRPDRPVVGLATVDQVGSRLLFRGYGVSPRMAPVHAGLLGNDVLYLLDEVHLAVPFAETLEQIRSRWRGPQKVQDRFQVVEMSATSGSGRKGFGLEEDDRIDPILSVRLGASKLAHLEEVPVRGEEATRRGQLASQAARRAQDLLRDGAHKVAVVVNRVDTARKVWRALEGVDGVDVQLLTGRMRPFDRDEVLTGEGGILPRVGAGAGEVERPIVVVATQSIEAGADLDFDGLVTECASLDALRQRFGRLDRRGTKQRTEAFILIRSDQAKDSEEDPVYGPALQATWARLAERGGPVDFGVGAFDVAVDASVLAPRLEAPVLLPAYLDAWAQTSPAPEHDPDIALWLHGKDSKGSPEVQVVWRSEVTEALVDELASEEAGTREEAQAQLEAALVACRPAAAEALAVPLFAARAWLRGDVEVEVADTEGGLGAEEAPRPRAAPPGRAAVRWSAEGVERVTASELRPGDTILVPCVRGGLTARNWDPAATAPVADLGDQRVALLTSGDRQVVDSRRASVRLWPEALAFWLGEDAGALIRAAPTAPKDEGDDLEQAIREWLERVEAEAGEVLPVRAGGFEHVVLPRGEVVLLAPRSQGRAGRDGASTEGDDSSFVQEARSLSDHSSDVKTWAQRFATNLGLEKALADDVVRAAYFHDLGKADPRFQRWLCGGSEVALARQTELLAKSKMGPQDRQVREQARRRAGYPRGERHELLSAALLAGSEALAGAADPELVLHLVASHHGWCRPFAPPLDPPEAVAVDVTLGGAHFQGTTRHGAASVGSGVAERFWAMNERYGRWTLAWLEAILRLADHRASEEGAG